MCRELTELLLMGFYRESTWKPTSKSNMLTPNINLLTFLTKGSFLRDEWNHLFVFLQYDEFSDIFRQPCQKILSQARGRSVIAMSKRGQHTTWSDGSPVAKARPTNLVMHSQCREDVSSQSSGSPVDPGNENNRKRVGLATGWLELRGCKFPSE